ncbi:retrotransposon protein, putative, ty3-gypsy subclass [Tanacetum coccineum]|uniref:Retrotransposon protein, putative, ty3-gypsy subclass n=1 Tax=Tanacetum coccineum TaxID=301880 RepID=A0ABQ5IXS2_9ASTR
MGKVIASLSRQLKPYEVKLSKTMHLEFSCGGFCHEVLETLSKKGWLEILDKDYDTDILYHPGKANVVAEATYSRVNLMLQNQRSSIGEMRCGLLCRMLKMESCVSCMDTEFYCVRQRSKFTSHFWKGITESIGANRLKFSTTFHPQTDGQSERTIQTLEDMLRACALEMARVVGSGLIGNTNEKVVVAKEKLKEARSRQKSYADKHRRDLEFQVGDRNVEGIVDITEFFRKLKFVCHWANPIKDFKWSNVPRVKLL